MTGSRAQSEYTFPKSQRLSSTKAIDALFTDAKVLKAYPLKFLYALQEEGGASQALPKVLISVPKRKFKKAVDRNLLKRRIREAYRLHKSLLENHNIASIGIIYVSDQTVSFKFIEDKLILAFHRLSKELNP